VNSANSFVDQSPFGFSFIASHHSLLPTSGEQADTRTEKAIKAKTLTKDLITDGITASSVKKGVSIKLTPD
jgi:hypothetical protein